MAYYALEDELRARGFRHEQHAPVICRWRLPSLVVDVLPVGDDNLLGFVPGRVCARAVLAFAGRNHLIMPAVYCLATRSAAPCDADD